MSNTTIPSTVMVATMSILAEPLLGVKTALNRLALKPESSEQVLSDDDWRIGSAETNGVKSEKNRRNGVNNMSGLILTALWSYTTGAKVARLKANAQLLIEFGAVGSDLLGLDNWIPKRCSRLRVRIASCCSKSQEKYNSPNCPPPTVSIVSSG